MRCYKLVLDWFIVAINVAERADSRTEQLREAGMQLVEALDRLESVERFQQRSRCIPPCRVEPSNGIDVKR
jgi:hypothetical protein